MPAMPAPDETVVLMRDVRDMDAQVQWTRRVDHYTLQIGLKSNTLGSTLGLPSLVSGKTGLASPKPLPHDNPPVQVWLLRADGTMIPPDRATYNTPENMLVTEYNFVYPTSAGEQAVAVAVMISGRYFIQRLNSFPDRKN
ncbi:MAG TPA: hypothetical protein VMH77_08460 [Steroidobacteraceae bacterium]|nr:hypothetical protein [Steroidobacteraceae bacterium]